MRKVWFTADTHFGHKRIPFYARRLFCLDDRERLHIDSIPIGSRSNWTPSQASVDRMDDHLIDRINQCVAKDDILWHLGDFCWGRGADLFSEAKRYRDRIACRNVYLVLGNHDSDEMAPLFRGCQDSCEIKVHSRNIVLCHYAHCFWNRSHYGSWMLYGHAHGTAEAWMDEHMPGRFSMDVGVDNVARLTGEYRPISYDEVAVLFSSRKGFQVDGQKMQAQTLRGR